MPFEIDADRRDEIPRPRHRVTNWPAYEAAHALVAGIRRQRGGDAALLGAELLAWRRAERVAGSLSTAGA